MRYLRLALTERYEPAEVARPGVGVTLRQRDLAGGPPVVWWYRTEVTGPAPVLAGRSVVLGDSFIEVVAGELLAPYFEELVFVQWRAIGTEGTGFSDTPVVSPNRENEDWLFRRISESRTVVVETIEFRSWQRFATPRMANRALRELSDQIPHRDLAVPADGVVDLSEAARNRSRILALVRSGSEAPPSALLLHRAAPAGEWFLIGTGEPAGKGAVVVDLAEAPPNGELRLRVSSAEVESIRIVWI
jgi:hypothetical protein